MRSWVTPQSPHWDSLGDETFDAAFAAGRAFDTAEIVALSTRRRPPRSNSA